MAYSSFYFLPNNKRSVLVEFHSSGVIKWFPSFLWLKVKFYVDLFIKSFYIILSIRFYQYFSNGVFYLNLFVYIIELSIDLDDYHSNLIGILKRVIS